MAESIEPTNEKIIAKLDEVLSELSELRRDQQRLSADVEKLAKMGAMRP